MKLLSGCLFVLNSISTFVLPLSEINFKTSFTHIIIYIKNGYSYNYSLSFCTCSFLIYPLFPVLSINVCVNININKVWNYTVIVENSHLSWNRVFDPRPR